MKKKLIIFFFMLSIGKLTNAQLIVDTSFTIEELVKDHLLGAGIEASNIKYTGADSAIGFFYGNTNLELDSGIILSTGVVVGANGPSGDNPSTNTMDTNLDLPGNSFLDALTGRITYDAAVLEFDFIAAADSIVFSYSFASEEYHDFICGNFNDAIAFLISSDSLKILDTNIALVPNTIDPVSVNSINFGDSFLTNCPPSNPQYLIDNMMGQSIRFNAFTKELTAKYPIVCNVPYHLKIIIADTEDGLYDSGLFLKAKGINSSPLKTYFISHGNAKSDFLYEGCGSGKLIFDRGNQDTASNQTIHYTISGSADMGIDFNNIRDSVYFPAGQDTVSVNIIAFSDTLTEGREQIIFTVIPDSSDTCNLIGKPQQHIVYIKDFIPLSMSLADSLRICEGDTIELSPDIINGVPPFSYSWNNQLDSNETLSANPSNDTTYILEIKDACNSPSLTDSIFIDVITSPPLSLILSNDTSIICPVKNYFAISAKASGGIPEYEYYWSNNVSGSDYINVKPSVSTTYYVLVKDSCGNKQAYDSVKVTVQSLPLSVTASEDVFLICPQDTAKMSATATGSKDNWIYLWDSPSGYGASGQTIEVRPKASTEFIVYVSDACGGPQLASDTIHVEVNVVDTLSLLAYGDTSVCPGTPIQLSSNGNGGIGDLDYAWSTFQNTYSFGQNNKPKIMVNPKESDLFIVSMSDSCGSMITDTVAVEIKNDCDVIVPNIITPNNDGINDVLFIDYLSEFDSHVLRIFNRWGKEVFRSTNYQNDWYGKGLNNGTYFYNIRLINDNAIIIKEGFITILGHE